MCFSVLFEIKQNVGYFKRVFLQRALVNVNARGRIEPLLYC